jgi:hypothetical protein
MAPSPADHRTFRERASSTVDRLTPLAHTVLVFMNHTAFRQVVPQSLATIGGELYSETVA